MLKSVILEGTVAFFFLALFRSANIKDQKISNEMSTFVFFLKLLHVKKTEISPQITYRSFHQQKFCSNEKWNSYNQDHGQLSLCE